MIVTEAKRQAALAELGRTALSGVSIPALMEQATTLVTQTLGVEYCQVLELLPDGRALLLRAGTGWKDGYVGRATVPAGRDSQAGNALLADAPVMVEDLRTEQRFPAPPHLLDHGGVSGVSVIIRGTGRPYGVLGAHTRTQRAFSQDDLSFLRNAANLLAMAIQRTRTDEELRVTRDRYSGMLAAALDCVITVDSLWRILEWNPAAERIFGYTGADALGKPMAELIVPAPFRQRYYLAMANYLATGDGLALNARLELRGLRADGTEFPVEATLTRIGINDAPLFTAYVRDITERKQVEETLNRQAERLSILHEIDLAILVTRSPEVIAEVALERIRRIAPYFRAAVTLFDLEAQEATLLAVSTPVQSRLPAGTRFPLQAVFGLDELLTGKGDRY